MGSSCSCCSDDTSEKDLPLLSSQIVKIADLDLNRHRKHIIKALYAVLSVGLHEMTSLFSSEGDDATSSAAAETDGAAQSSTDELILALDRTITNLDNTLTKKQRLEIINRSIPLDQDVIRQRLLQYATKGGVPNSSTNNNKTSGSPSSTTTEMTTAPASLQRIRSQSMAPRGGKELSSHQRYYLPRILELWFQADRDCSGSLEPAEIKDLLHQMNIDIPYANVVKLIKEVDTSNNGQVEFNEFVEFYNRLTAIDAIKVLSTRLGMNVVVPIVKPKEAAAGGNTTPSKAESKKRTNSMVSNSDKKQTKEITIIPEDALKLFLTGEQRESSAADVASHVRRIGKLRSYGGGDGSPAVFGVLQRDFQLYLLDAACNSWIHPRENEVWMDMTQPYTHYFIDSSHNTYLAGHQLQGQSSCEMYKKALLSGCRCIELDCWDGPNNDPIVTHGFTLTTRLRFFDVIQTIKQFGFETSSYPIMLSIELHCSPPQQEVMVKMMKDAWGSNLLSAADAESSKLRGSEFTPAGLEYKVLVKGKRLAGSVLSVEEVALLDQQTEEEKSSGSPPAISASTSTSTTAGAGAGAPHGKKHDICDSLNAITYIAAMPFVSPEAQLKLPHYGVSSVDENKIERWCKEGPQRYIDVAKQFLIRVYPKGLRTDSSNYIPQPSWNCGAQLVAMNIQTNDEGNRLNRYKFRTNGQCGMILKPLCMRQPGATVAQSLTEWIITVRILCGVQLPKPGRSTRGEIIDPFVELFVVGYGTDDCSGDRKRTRTIANNGFNPHWDESFSFTVTFPELATLWIQVHERDPITTEFIADNAAPISALREGYRCVPLYVDGVELPSPTCLMCMFTIKKKDASGKSPTVPLQQQQSSGSVTRSIGGKEIVLDAFTSERLDML